MRRASFTGTKFGGGGTPEAERFAFATGQEARACGTPFVVRANSSYLATAKNGEGGFFTDNQSEEEMARMICEILKLPFNEWKKLSKLAVKSTENFSWKNSAREYIDLYRFLIRRKKMKFHD